MTTNISAFYPWVLPSVPGCPDIVAMQAIRSACIDFCSRTDLIQRIITADATAGVEDYVISPPTDMTRSRILSLGYQGRSLIPVSPDVVNSDVALRGAAVGTAVPISGDPVYYFNKMPNDAGFSIYPIPAVTVTLGLTVKVTFAPSNTATTVDDSLFGDWVDAIAAGAINLLMMMPGYPFSSATNAKGFSNTFERGIVAARRIKYAGYLPGSLRAMPVPFA